MQKNLGEIIGLGTAQETEPVGQDFERAFAEHQAVLLDAFLQDLEDQVLLLEAAVIDQLLRLGDVEELRNRHLLQFGDVRGAAFDLLVAAIGFRIEADMFLFAVGRVIGVGRRFVIENILAELARLILGTRTTNQNPPQPVEG